MVKILECKVKKDHFSIDTFVFMCHTLIMKRVNVNLTDAKHKQFKMVCVSRDLEMSNVIRKLIEGFVKAKSKKH